MHFGGSQRFSVRCTSLCDDTPGLSGIGIGITGMHLFEANIQEVVNSNGMSTAVTLYMIG